MPCASRWRLSGPRDDRERSRRHDEDLRPLEDDGLAAVAAAGLAIEIDTFRLDRHPAAEMYPPPDLLVRAHAGGIALTLGSDAHHAAELGAHFAEATGAIDFTQMRMYYIC